VSLTAEGAIPFNAEEFTDPSELRALTELIGEAQCDQFGRSFTFFLMGSDLFSTVFGDRDAEWRS
jgi:hypothetical protein